MSTSPVLPRMERSSSTARLEDSLEPILEHSPLMQRAGSLPRNSSTNSIRSASRRRRRRNERNERKTLIYYMFISLTLLIVLYILGLSDPELLAEEFQSTESMIVDTFLSSLKGVAYERVQTVSFQIYTGGAPAFIIDEDTGEEIQNEECFGFHSYGLPGDDDAKLQCYIGLEDSADDVRQRMGIMRDAVNQAYESSSKDPSVLKIFIAPEFYWRGLNGAYELLPDFSDDTHGGCSDICHILKSLEEVTADERFVDWIFLFGTVIASEALPTEDQFDYQFYNFAPLYRGYDPAKSPHPAGKRFLVPKRYVSNLDFLTPMRHLTNETVAVELLDEEDPNRQATPMKPRSIGHNRYDNEMWSNYKKELADLGYTMIEHGWFMMDGISFSVEICLDHLVHRALVTYMADVVTGGKTLIPSFAENKVEWVSIPRHQAQISLVSSAGMDVVIASLALADGGVIFLQDGLDGNVQARSAFGEDQCLPNTWKFFGGSQSVIRKAVLSPTDVTFEYDMNLDFDEIDLYPEQGTRNWTEVLGGVFSKAAYPPRLTIYNPIDIAEP
mmetsp:Transcript_19695/g.46220  ORF Transcript_19695/g.46220 Transcript_19695/m.46220 type:complete len:556 (+) Transcript_19695:67-1734(+)